jgi:hypothetical protein
MANAMIGRGMIALVAATLLLDGALELLSPSLPPGMLTPLGLTPIATSPIFCWVLAGVPLLLIRSAAPVGGISTTAMLGYVIAQPCPSGLQLGIIVLGVTMWLGLALVHPPVRALFSGPRARAPTR